ncbi:MAG: gamma-glutamyl-gamma-aminobutyrate hydrolase family protein, partial [Nakamurella sp.]
MSGDTEAHSPAAGSSDSGPASARHDQIPRPAGVAERLETATEVDLEAALDQTAAQSAAAPRSTAPTAPDDDAQAHPVLVVDFGAQYAQLIARRVREANVYSEIVPSSISTAEIAARQPAAVILSGGPSSVYADGAPGIDPALFDTDIPVFGICYGFQAMALALGGDV